jgi:Tfp pilus assembly protein PilF
VSWARRLAAGDFTWPVIPLHGPGYPLFLALWLALGSGSLHLAIAAQAVVGALTAVIIAATARDGSGARAGLIAGLAYAIYGPAAYIDTALLSEGLLLFFLSLSLFLLAKTPLAGGRAAAAGAALGAAMLVRPTALLTLIAAVVWVAGTLRRDRRRALTIAGVLLGVSLLVTLPALLQSWSVSHSLNLQGYGGVNFYVGNSPLHDGRGTFRLGGGWDALNTEASRAGISDPAAQDRYYVAKTWSEIRQHPAAFAALLSKKALWSVQAEEVRDSHSYYFFADRAPVLRVLPRMAILFPLACLGVVVLVTAHRRERSATFGKTVPLGGLLLLYALAALSGTVLLIVGMRYRMPLAPLMAIAAGIGVADGIAFVAEGRNRALAVGALAIVVAVVISHLLSDPRNRNLAEEWAFTGSSLITEHNLPEAETAYQRALALDSQSGLAADGLGLTCYDEGRLADARKWFERALAIDPDNGRAAFHLALVDEREGHLDAAVAGYRRALDRSPHDADITRHLATGLGMLGRSEEARTEMRRVVELEPMNGEAWLDVCLLSLDLHDVDAAAPALQRARELGAEPARLDFAAQALARARAAR